MKNKLSKILLTILAIMLFIPSQLVQVFATGIGDSPYLERGDKGFYSVQYLTKSGEWMYITYSRTFFTDSNGVRRIAYCVDSDLKGIGWISGEVEGYNVNLTEALKDERLWRVYRHGYPYVTPEALGVETEDDAYLATKQAGYCVIQGRPLDDIYKHFRAGEERIEGESLSDIQRRGKKVVDAIYRLVELGYNGTETPKYNDLIQISKVGECGQDSNAGYFSQKYSVKSSTVMNEYSIESLTGFPSGTYTADLNGTSKSTFSAGEQFKVMIPINQISNDIDGKISIKGKCENYPIYYGKAQEGKQNYAVLVDSFSDATADTTCHVEGNKSKIKIIKTDSDTKQKLEGVEFNFKYENGDNIGNYKTDKNGEINLERLRAGNVIVTEVKTKAEYILNTAEQKVSLAYNQLATIELQNDHKKGNVKVYKVDKDNHKVVLGNVEFDLYSVEFGKVIGTYKTDVNGEIEIKNLRVGDYKLIEKSTGKWYNLTNDTDIKVEWNLTKEIQIENELKKGQVRVIKVDKDNKEVKLSGVKFDVLDKNGKVLETITTNTNGEAMTSKYAIRDFEELTIKEKETLQEYKLNTEKKTIKLEENQIKNITFENELKKAKIQVIKTDVDTKVTLKDVEFDVIDNTTKSVVDHIKTNEKGEATTKDLRIDHTYTLKETKTGEYYKLNKETTTVDLTKYIKNYKENIVEKVNITNEKKKGQVQIIKIDKDDNKVFLEGVKFNVLDENKKVVDTLITDKNGKATSKKLPIDQKYIVQETETLETYVLNNEPKTIVLTEDKITSIKFENEKIKGQIKIVKTSEDDNFINNKKAGEPIENVKFELYDKNHKLIEELTTDKDGIAVSKILYKGKYFIKEVSSGEWYLLNDKEFTAEIKVHKEIVEVDVKNKSEKPSVDIEKTGIIQTTANQEIKYDFKIKNTGNVALNNFTWTDALPTDYIRITKLITGTYNQDLRYSIFYKTNKNEYRLLKENLSTKVNNYIDFSNLNLENDEYVTDFKVDFGTVEVGFESEINPYIFTRLNSNVKNDDTFTNKTRIEGYNKTYMVWDEDDHTTKVYEKQINVKKLPRTGF